MKEIDRVSAINCRTGGRNMRKLVKRILAFQLDLFIASILSFVFAILLLIIGKTHTIIIEILFLRSEWISVVYILFFMFLYFTLQECLLKTTIGKVIFGLYVTDEYGNKPKFIQTLIRNIFRITDNLFWLGSITIIKNNENKRLGDIVSHTIISERNSQ